MYNISSVCTTQTVTIFKVIYYLSVQFSHSVVSDSLRPHESQHARPPCPSPTPGVQLRLTSIESVMPSSHLILCRPLLLLPPIPSSIRVFSNESTLRMRWPAVLEFQLQHHSFQRTPRTDLQNGLVGSPCCPRDCQESSPTPQFKSINSSALSLLHSPTLTSIHDHRKKHSLDQTDLCWQSNVSAFEYAIQVGHNFPSKE